MNFMDYFRVMNFVGCKKQRDFFQDYCSTNTLDKIEIRLTLTKITKIGLKHRIDFEVRRRFNIPCGFYVSMIS